MFFIIVTKSAPSNKCGIENRIAINRPCRLSSKFILLVECRMHFSFSDNERTTELANCFVCQRNSFFSCGGVFIADDLHYLKLSLNRIENPLAVHRTTGQKKYGDSRSTAAIQMDYKRGRRMIYRSARISCPVQLARRSAPDSFWFSAWYSSSFR